MAVFAMSFYGPNATIMGTIKLSIFQYKAVSDIGALMQTLAFFWFVGFCSFLFDDFGADVDAYGALGLAEAPPTSTS